jgi:hypothetical protein
MSVEKTRALMHRWFDESNKGKAAALAVADEICAADIIVHGITESRGLKNYKRFIGEVYDAFPDKCATNKKVTIRGIEIDRVARGKFVEVWSTFETSGLIQIGLVQAREVKKRPAGRPRGR